MNTEPGDLRPRGGHSAHPLHRPAPIVYSCSGCSSAAQLANHVALRLDRCGAAEMSCIAGVGGDVPHLMKLRAQAAPSLRWMAARWSA